MSKTDKLSAIIKALSLEADSNKVMSQINIKIIN